MPYNPQIQDISGQLIAQGMSQAGAIRAKAKSDLASTIADTVTGGIRQYQQNRVLTQQALGKFGQGMENPEFKQYVTSILSDESKASQVPSSIVSAVKKAQKGDINVYDAALLGSFVDTFAKSKQDEAQRLYTNALREQTLANQKSIDAATEDRKRQAEAVNRMRNATKEYRDLMTMDRDGAPMTIEQAERFNMLKDNELIRTVAQGEEVGLDAPEAIKLFQNQQAMDLRGDLAIAQRTAADAERARRIAEAEAKQRAASRPPYGAKKTYRINDKAVVATWDGEDWVDDQTGMPINLRATPDQYGRLTYSNVPNPALFGTVPGLNDAMGGGAGGMPSVGGVPGTGGVPGAGAPPPPDAAPAAPKSFKTQQEAEAAYRAGKLRFGERVIINGIERIVQRSPVQ